MTATTRASRASCQAAARRRWGKKVVLRENANAMTASQRESHREKQRALKAELDALDSLAKTIGGEHWPNLLKAAEFFLDVNGDEPSNTQLRKAVADAQRAQDITEQRKAARAAWESGRGLGSRHRWEVYEISYVGNLAAFSHVHCEADTLDELLEKIEASG